MKMFNTAGLNYIFLDYFFFIAFLIRKKFTNILNLLSLGCGRFLARESSRFRGGREQRQQKTFILIWKRVIWLV